MKGNFPGLSPSVGLATRGSDKESTVNEHPTNPDLSPNDPLEPGETPDPSLGLSDEEAGFPNHDAPEDDEDLGEAEFIEGDGDDIDPEED